MVDATDLNAKSVLIPETSMIARTYIASQTFDEHVLKEKYLEKGLSLIDIAREFSSSKTTIRSYLIKYKIPLRETGKTREATKKRIYGKRLVNGKVVDHKGEQRVIDSILRMKSEGLSFNAIARVLNDMKVKTKNQGKKWHMEVVRQIYLREVRVNR